MKGATEAGFQDSGASWMGRVPERWKLKRLKYIANRRDEKVEAEGDTPLPYVGLEHIEPRTGRLLPLDDDLVPTGISNRFRRGETLFGKLRPYLAKACTANFDGLCSSELLVLTSLGQDRRFLLYGLLSEGFISLVDASTYGAKMPRAGWEFIGSCMLPLPPLPEQRAIADFLDAQTAKLDTLVAKKRELIEKLKEKRTALISHTVTRGLPPEAARAAGLDPHPKLKPSGIAWIGDVPEHWSVLPFTKYVAEKSDYRGKTPEKVASGVFLVTARNVKMGFIDYETSQEYVAEEEYHEIMRRGLPRLGDILFTTEAPLGNIALVDREDIALAQRVIRFRMKPEQFNGRFTLYGMMSDHFQLQLASLSTGSTAEGLKASKLPLLRLVAPAIVEQLAIADYLDRETSKIDALVTKVEAAIERLKEYRSALITAAVTGKIDVRSAGA